MDTMAIDGAQVSDMKSAIESYTLKVEEDLSNIKAYEINAGDGVYGINQVDNINTYIENTCTEINAIVRYFDEFQEALHQVSIEYINQQGKINPGDVSAHKTASDDMITVNRMS